LRSRGRRAPAPACGAGDAVGRSASPTPLTGAAGLRPVARAVTGPLRTPAAGARPVPRPARPP
jgi:hypothetical protein